MCADFDAGAFDVDSRDTCDASGAVVNLVIVTALRLETSGETLNRASGEHTSGLTTSVVYEVGVLSGWSPSGRQW